MMSLFRLRKTERDLERPYKAICYPAFPAIALVGAVICFALMIYYNFNVFVAFVIIMAVCYGYYLYNRKNISAVVVVDENGEYDPKPMEESEEVEVAYVSNKSK